MEQNKQTQATQDLADILAEARQLLHENDPAPTSPPANSAQERRQAHDRKVITALLITACVLCAGIIAILAYWLAVLL